MSLLGISKRILLLSFLLNLEVQSTSAQNLELSAGVGYAYYYGDLNTKNLEASAINVFGEGLNLKNFKLSYSVGSRYYMPKMFSIGINFYHLYLSGYDSDNNISDPTNIDYGRQIRNLSFHTAVNAGFLDFQFEPLRTPKTWGSYKMIFSPYLGAGIGFFQFNPKAMYNGQEVALQPLGTEGQGLPGYAPKYRLVDIMIPVNAGLKVYFPSRRVSLAVDFNYNYTFTDYIDDVSTVYPNPIDIQNAYQTTNPALYNLVTAMSDRGLNPHAPGEKRGTTNADFFLTGQLKFGYLLDVTKGSRYYDCYQH